MLLAIQYIAEDLFPENMCGCGCGCGCVCVRVCAPIVGECCVCVCFVRVCVHQYS